MSESATQTADWGDWCPNCEFEQSRDRGPGATHDCPECGWPMHCIDFNKVRGETNV